MSNFPFSGNWTFDRAGLPERARGWTLERFAKDPPDPEAFEKVEAWVVDLRQHLTGGNGLVLIGPAGLGKTLLASIVGNEAVKLQASVGYLTSTDFIDMCDRMRMQHLDDESKNEIDRKIQFLANQMGLAIIDDFGKERSTDYARDKLEYVLRHRYDRCRSTILTTNMPMGEIAKTYGGSFASMLEGANEIVKFAGEDRRRGRR